MERGVSDCLMPSEVLKRAGTAFSPLFSTLPSPLYQGLWSSGTHSEQVQQQFKKIKNKHLLLSAKKWVTISLPSPPLPKIVTVMYIIRPHVIANEQDSIPKN